MENIKFNDLSFTFKEADTLLQNINAEFATGKVHLLTGISGSGKSTLLKLIAGLLPKYGGKITTGDCHVPANARVGMLFQDPLMQFALDTPRHELEFTLENCQLPAGQMANRITAALDFAQVSPLAERKITTLSGGQQQRVALAVVVAMQPAILLLDEPFANIDEQTRTFILRQLAKLNREQGTTIIITDHDCSGYQALHPQIWQLTAGRLKALVPAAGQQLLQKADQQRKVSFNTTIPTPNANSIIQLKNMTIARGGTTLLQPSTLNLIKHKVTLITGLNGVGKSTLLAAIAKLTNYGGTIMYNHTDISKISPGKYFREVGLVFQRAADQFLNVTVGEELALSIKNGCHPYFTGEHLQQALTDLDLAGHEDQVVYSLSGGQKKKLQILLMLMMGQSILLFDEPFTGLDEKSLTTVLTLIQRCQQTLPQTIIIVSHQLAGLASVVDYHLLLQDQQLTYQRS